ncbi:MAG TPA: DUF6265 family protein [Bacteroidales bacterium]|jgi:hypothetical protein|nr:DUF6265 family protein [Bacteroidales bacterium]HOL98295.1 DUF6265 family protein [Bacteroidales bacterium]HOM36635.1 DUF6265 family protein [Bacteroidales bacterium]HPD24072.1 DUF6265 family protein [Bacteroidales bacterium]HRT00063.1 DUF6265 family protein [Bacteroidales bacterium]
MKKFLFISIYIFLTALNSLGQFVKEFPVWLVGTWQIESEHGFSYESWEIVSDNFLKGKTFRVFGTDTIVFDTMNLKISENKIIYELTATANSKKVFAGYVLTRLTEDLWRFENSITDFPTAIIYQKLSPQKVYVWTEARNKDAICTDFTMTKIK